MICPETVAEANPLLRQVSGNSTLLRVPPFPLPHRVLQCPASESFRRSAGPKGPPPVSKRVSSIPPPLALENIYAQRLEGEEEDSPVLGWEETRRLMGRQPSTTNHAEHHSLARCNAGVQSEARGRRYSMSRAPQNL